jgi:hypothetical protein
MYELHDVRLLMLPLPACNYWPCAAWRFLASSQAAGQCCSAARHCQGEQQQQQQQQQLNRHVQARMLQCSRQLETTNLQASELLQWHGLHCF